MDIKFFTRCAQVVLLCVLGVPQWVAAEVCGRTWHFMEPSILLEEDPNFCVSSTQHLVKKSDPDPSVKKDTATYTFYLTRTQPQYSGLETFTVFERKGEEDEEVIFLGTPFSHWPKNNDNPSQANSEYTFDIERSEGVYHYRVTRVVLEKAVQPFPSEYIWSEVMFSRFSVTVTENTAPEINDIAIDGVEMIVIDGTEKRVLNLDGDSTVSVPITAKVTDATGSIASVRVTHGADTATASHLGSGQYKGQLNNLTSGTQKVTMTAQDSVGGYGSSASEELEFEVNYKPKIIAVNVPGSHFYIEEGNNDSAENTVFTNIQINVTTNDYGEGDLKDHGQVQVCLESTAEDSVSNCSSASNSANQATNPLIFTRNILTAALGEGTFKVWAKDIKDAHTAVGTHVHAPQITISSNKSPLASVAIAGNGATTYRQGDGIELAVSASDEDGSIKKMELLFAGGNFGTCVTEGTSDTAGSCALIDLGGGQYTIHVDTANMEVTEGRFEIRVTDDKGMVKTSPPTVEITIEDLTAPAVPVLSIESDEPNTTGRYDLRWTAVDADQYTLQRCTQDCNNEAEWADYRSFGASSSQTTEIVGKGQYHYRLEACAVQHIADAENRLCTVSAEASIAVTPTKPVFPLLTDYDFKVTPPQSGGDYHVSWPALDASDAGSEVHYYLLEEKAGNLQCASGDTTCEEAWLEEEPIRIDATANLFVAYTHKPLGEHGSYTYRLSACNDYTGCTTSPVVAAEIFPPRIENITVACGGSCLQVAGAFLSPQITARVQPVAEPLLSVTHVLTVSENGGFTVPLGYRTALSEALLNQGVELMVTNANGETSQLTLPAKQSSVSVLLTDATPALSKDHSAIYVAAGSKLHAIDMATGQELVTASSVWPFEIPNSQLTTPVVNLIDGNVYVGATDQHLYAVTPEGKYHWRSKMGGEVIASPALGETSIVYTGAMDGKLSALHPETGKIKWQTPAFGSGIVEQPYLSADGYIYLTTANGEVHIVSRRDIQTDALVWDSVDDSLMAYDLTVSGWEPSEEDKSHYSAVARLFRLLLQPELNANKDVITFWTFALASQVELDVVAQAFLSSTRGQANFPTLLPLGTHDNFLQALYLRAFNESGVDQNGVFSTEHYQPFISHGRPFDYQDLLTQLNNGASRASIAILFSESIPYFGQTQRILQERFDAFYTPDYSWTDADCNSYDCDTDGDGLWDHWEELYFGTINQYSWNDTINDTVVGIAFSQGTDPCEDMCAEVEAAPAPQLPSLPSKFDANIEASAKVGAITGDFSVNEAGAATYDVPVTVAPGVAGVTPQIALSYSSQAGNGLMGQGWDISGLSAISRCRQTRAVDGISKPIAWNTDDRFCLDGQRLIVDSASSYHANGSTYRTEIDSKVWVTYYSAGKGYFKVERQDGSVSYYGKTAGSTVTGGNGKALVWALNSFQDSVGSEPDITFEYANDADGQRIKHIRYAYSGSTSHADVTFEYQAGQRADARTVYVAGYSFAYNKLLDQVVTRSDNEELRRYKLGYRDLSESFNKINKLQDIQECVGDLCREAKLSFGWTEPQVSYERGVSASMRSKKHRGLYTYKPADINGDGYQDVMYLQWQVDPDDGDTDHRFQYMLANNGRLEQAKFAEEGTSNTSDSLHYSEDVEANGEKVVLEVIDYNADGRQDAIVYRTNGNEWSVHLSIPKDDGSWALSSERLSTGIHVDSAQFIDMNGDGLQDAFYMDDTGKAYVRYLEVDPDVLDASSNVYYHFSDTPTELSVDGNAWPEIERADYAITHAYNLVDIGGQDVNGDGIVDMLIERRTSACDIGLLEDGTQYEICDFSYAYGMFTLVSNHELTVFNMIADEDISGNPIWYEGDPKYDGYYTLPALPPKEVPLKILMTDINGDGLSDMYYTLENKSTEAERNWAFKLSDGTGFIGDGKPVYKASGQTAFTKDENFQWVDMNQDGYLDLTWVDDATYAKLWDPMTENFLAKQKVNDYSGADDVRYLDVNGDGVSDMIRVHASNQTVTTAVASPVVGDEWVNGALYERGEVQFGRANMMTSVYNGFGSLTEIQYEPLSNTDHYSRPEHGNEAQAGDFYAAINGEWDIPTEYQRFSRDNSEPVLDLLAPMYVVTAVSSHAAATALEDRHATLDVAYYYSGLKVQAAGRGMLGFKQIRTVDEDRKVETTTHYRQDFPFIGMPWRTEQKRLDDGHKLSVSENTWVLNGWDGDNEHLPDRPYQPYVAENVATQYDVETDRKLSTVTTLTEEVDDVYAHVKKMTVNTFDHRDNNTYRVSTENTYFEGPDEHRFARIKSTTVTHQRPATETITRHSAFTYYDAGAHKGLLQSSTVEPDSPLPLTTQYTYDAVGNKTVVSVSGYNGYSGEETRSTTYEYDDNQRFLLSEKNHLGQQASTKVYNAAGQVTQLISNSDATVSDIVYDAFGRKVYERSNTGGFTQTLITAGEGSYCDFPTQYHATITSADGGESYICYDAFGRETKTGQRGFEGFEWYVTNTEYNIYGQVTRKTLPYTEGLSSAHWVEYDYDLQGRVVTTRYPDDSASAETVDYQKWTTVITNRKRQKKTEVRNVLGELVSVTDALGGTIDYTYDAIGNVTDTTTSGPVSAPGAGTSINVSITYDPIFKGRWKTAMSDPDKGDWQYVYNAFGELVRQTDARRYVTEMRYDTLGRMQCRVDLNAHNTVVNSSQWVFDSGQRVDASGAVLGQAIGLPAQVLQGSSDCRTGSLQNPSYQQTYTYDAYGRAAETETVIDGNAYTERVTYDAIGRVFQQFDVTGFERGTRNVYNSTGYLTQVRDAQIINGEQKVYRLIQAMDAQGHVLEELHNNGLTTVRNYDAVTGDLTDIYTSLDGIDGSVVQNQTLEYDVLGNLLLRSDAVRETDESFCYDDLNRLTGTAIGTACNDGDIVYDSFGNFISKPGVGAYTYGSESSNAGPHAVSSVEKDGVITRYHYDNNGNMTQDDTGRVLKYTGFDKPSRIIKGTHKTEFDYAPSRQRYKRTDYEDDNQKAVTYYFNNVELIQRGTTISAKRYVAGNTIIDEDGIDQEREWGSWRQSYILRDHLGSVDVIVGETSQTFEDAQFMSFDAWGARREGFSLNADLDTMALLALTNITRRGFTGHEMLDAVGLIHMNGRVYDPVLGRFLSADPIIQAPGNTQSYNRYAYVWNNPMAMTDPSGYSGRKLRSYLGSALQIVGTILLPSGWGAALIAIGGAISGRANGNTAQGVATAAFSAAAFYGIGQYFKGAAAVKGTAGTYQFGGLALTAPQIGAQVAAHAVTGGIIAEMQGGEFGHGFISAGVTKAAGGAFLGNEMGADLLISAAIGGTVSELTGGKFANGAVTGAMQYAFNQAMSQKGGSSRGNIKGAYDETVEYINSSLEDNPNSAVSLSSEQLDTIVQFEALEVSGRGTFVSANELINEGDGVFRKYGGVSFNLTGKFYGMPAGIHSGGNINYYYQGLLQAHSWNISSNAMHNNIVAWNMLQAGARGSQSDLLDMGAARAWANTGANYYGQNYGK